MAHRAAPKKKRPDLFREHRARKGRLPEEGLSSYLGAFPDLPLLTREEEYALGRKVQKSRSKRVAGEAWRTLILHNIRLVVKEAVRYATKNRIDTGDAFVMDVISEGLFGLLDAASRYDPNHGCRFSTYATYWIRRHILKALNTSRMIRVPYYMHGILSKIPWATAKLASEGNRRPTSAEMSEVLKCTPKELDRTITITSSTKVYRPSTYDAPDTEVHTSYIDYQPDLDATPVDTLVENEEQSDMVWLALSKMEDREAHILMLRYGFGADKRYTLQAIGQLMNLSREGVRQLEQSGLEHFHEFYLEAKSERPAHSEGSLPSK